MNKSKKIFITIGICLLVITLLSLSFFIDSDNKESADGQLSEDPNTIINNAQKQSANVKENEKKEFTEIKMNNYLEYYSGSEAKIVLIGYPACSYCQIAEPILQNIAYEYNLEINYLNTDNFTEEDKKALSESNEFFSKNEGFGTPLVLIVKDKEIVNKVDGLTDYEHYKKFFKSEGLIK